MLVNTKHSTLAKLLHVWFFLVIFSTFWLLERIMLSAFFVLALGNYISQTQRMLVSRSWCKMWKTIRKSKFVNNPCHPNQRSLLSIFHLLPPDFSSSSLLLPMKSNLLSNSWFKKVVESYVLWKLGLYLWFFG